MHIELSPVVAAIVAADKANNAAFSACRKAAAAVFERRDAAASIKTEYGRLMDMAKKLVADEGAVLTNRNTWLHVGQHLLTMFEPDLPIEVGTQGKGDKKAVTLKPAKTCKTAREVAAAAKQIRESTGMADGRASNNGKSKSEEPAKPARASWFAELEAVLHDAELLDRMREILKAEGWVLQAVKGTRKAGITKPGGKRSAMAQQIANQQLQPAASH